MSLNVVAN